MIDDAVSDGEILSLLRKRLRNVHVAPAQCLAACVCQPRLVKDPVAFAGFGVDPAVFLAFAASLLYNLSDPRAATLLMNISGGLPILPVPRFLELLERGGGNGGLGSAELVRMKPIRTSALTAREKGLLISLRDYLFEQRAKMKHMFEQCGEDSTPLITARACTLHHPLHCLRASH